MAYIDSIDEPTGNVPVEVSKVQDTSANTVVAFDYNGALAHLSEDARAKYLADVSREIDIDKPVTIRSYGQEITNAVDKIADKIIDKTRSDKDIVVADLTNNLLIELEQLRVPQDKGGFVSFLKRLPGVRYLVRKTREAVIENGMMGKNVRDIKEKFVAIKADCMAQSVEMDDMYQTAKEYIVESREKILSMMVLRDEVKRKLRELESAEYVDMDELQKYRNADADLSRQITSFATNENLFQQNMLQIAVLKGGCSSLIDKCESSIRLIPVVRAQLAMAVETEKQKYGVTVAKKFDDFANDVITQNMNILKENAVELAKMTENPSIKIETLEDTKNTLIDMVHSVKEIQARGEEQRERVREGLVRISQELHDAVREEL